MKKTVTALLLAVVFCLSVPGTAFAAYLTYGWPTTTIPVKPYSYSSEWQVPLDMSLSNWNNAGAKVTFVKTATSDNAILVDQYADTWVGLNSNRSVGNRMTSFNIKLNETIISIAATNHLNYVQSVFVHELGHCIWFNDNPATSSASIMKYGRDRNTMTLPQSFDIENVKAKY
jgi:hypothetical protein